MKKRHNITNRKTDAVEKVKGSIKNDILNGLLYPHQRLIEMEIASKLAMSRTPVREALKQLEIEGLVARLPTGRLIVKPITSDEIRNTFEVREALETMAIRLVCENITPKALAKLKGYLRNYQDAVNKSIREKTLIVESRWSTAFHNELYLACDNPKLIKHIQELWDIERLTYVSKYFDKSDYELFHEQHNRILQSTGQGDHNKAIEAVKTHLDTMCQIYLRYM